jgi:hypothetical protein
MYSNTLPVQTGSIGVPIGPAPSNVDNPAFFVGLQNFIDQSREHGEALSPEDVSGAGGVEAQHASILWA